MPHHDDQDNLDFKLTSEEDPKSSRIHVNPIPFNDYLTLILARTYGLKLHHHHGFHPCRTVTLDLNRIVTVTLILTENPTPNQDPYTWTFSVSTDVTYATP
ncbi:Meiosis 1 Arrest Protein [Manis pentadactyla]|nr:Meiosis 1 Arrest Protein [Manis pentadactyla]